jgi:uncharacterized protein with PQ loop repeat
MTRLDYIVTMLVLIEPIASIPQVLKIFSTQSAEDLFLGTWLVGFVANIAWLVYGIKTKKVPVLLSAIFWLCIHGLTSLGIILYG